MAKEIFCPYCNSIVRASKVRWLWLLISIPTGFFLLYLIYCALVRTRVCTRCHRRIYDGGGRE